jgi:hypothetical protein
MPGSSLHLAGSLDAFWLDSGWDAYGMKPAWSWIVMGASCIVLGLAYWPGAFVLVPLGAVLIVGAFIWPRWRAR